jgi:hypothetical protein
MRERTAAGLILSKRYLLILYGRQPGSWSTWAVEHFHSDYRIPHECQFNMRRINTSGSTLIALAINTISAISVLRWP